MKQLRGVGEFKGESSILEIEVISRADTFSGYPCCPVLWLLVLENYGRVGDEVL
jgi:hypothetical protein